jgi:hypothetical protein
VCSACQVRRHAYFTFDDWRVRAGCWLAGGCDGQKVAALLDEAMGWWVTGVLCCVLFLGSSVVLLWLRLTGGTPAVRAQEGVGAAVGGAEAGGLTAAAAGGTHRP